MGKCVGSILLRSKVNLMDAEDINFYLEILLLNKIGQKKEFNKNIFLLPNDNFSSTFLVAVVGKVPVKRWELAVHTSTFLSEFPFSEARFPFFLWFSIGVALSCQQDFRLRIKDHPEKSS